MTELKQIPIPDKDVLDMWTDRVATNIDEIILDRIEPQLNELGWFKERTCQVTFKRGAMYDVAHYSCCGYEYPELVSETGVAENYCPNCGAKVMTDEH